jgi:hypothetical protein
MIATDDRVLEEKDIGILEPTLFVRKISQVPARGLPTAKGNPPTAAKFMITSVPDSLRL